MLNIAAYDTYNYGYVLNGLRYYLVIILWLLQSVDLWVNIGLLSPSKLSIWMHFHDPECEGGTQL
jgi:hypothetical protein